MQLVVQGWVAKPRTARAASMWPLQPVRPTWHGISGGSVMPVQMEMNQIRPHELRAATAYANTCIRPPHHVCECDCVCVCMCIVTATRDACPWPCTDMLPQVLTELWDQAAATTGTGAGGGGAPPAAADGGQGVGAGARPALSSARASAAAAAAGGAADRLREGAGEGEGQGDVLVQLERLLALDAGVKQLWALATRAAVPEARGGGGGGGGLY